MKRSILLGIYDAINTITWKTPTLKYNALRFCEVLYNNFCYKNIPFNNYYEMPQLYLKTFIPKSDYLQIVIKELTNNNIIEVNNDYSNNKDGKGRKSSCKGYKFNYNLIINNLNNLNYIVYVSPSKTLDSTTVSNDKILNFEQNIIENYTLKMLGNISIDEQIHQKIEDFKIEKNEIILKNDIKEGYYKLFIKNEKYKKEEVNLKYAKTASASLNLDLFLYDDKLYIDDLNSFITSKETQVKLFNKLKVYDIQNALFTATRNETNKRLDTNITNFSSQLFQYINFKNEPLVECDIKNSQFAFLCYTTTKLDKLFITWSKKGILYDKTAEKLKITRKEAKQLMFEVAFGKINKETPIANIFPQTMLYINNYKKENGYKAFSNLLQRTESEVMIDGLLIYLIQKGYEVLTVHDSIRVNKLMAPIIKKEMNNYFKSIKFDCKISDK